MASSTGEMIAIAVHGRAHARSFGLPTAGFTTAVSGAPDRHGNFFGFPASHTAERSGRRIFPKLVPDVIVDSERAPSAQADAALDAAMGWLRAQ